MGIHGAVAAKALGDAHIVQAVFKDWRTAPVNDKVRAMLGYIEKMTLHPEALGPADIAPLREAGLSDEAIEQGIYICGIFNTLVRMADTLNFQVLEGKGLSSSVRFLLTVGYR